FFLNRVSFSGLGLSGGFSESAALQRFTDTSIQRIKPLAETLKGVTITNKDILDVLPQIPDGAFVFLDPPYFSAKRLYGKRGDLHAQFRHQAFVQALAEQSKRFHFLMTYDRAILDEPELAQVLKQFQLKEWRLQYGMDSFA